MSFSLETLEYAKLLELSAAMHRRDGADRFADLRPFTSRNEVERELRAVSETITLNEKAGDLVVQGLEDPTDAVAILRIRTPHSNRTAC